VLNITDSNSDTNLETVIEAVSRLIDNACGRHFFNASETRYYKADESDRIFVDDIASSSGITIYTDEDGDGTYENTWQSTDFNLASYNASTDGWPYQMIETTPQGDLSFPRTKKGIKITATFGWAAVPKPVTLACILQSAREYKRFKAVLGVAGATAIGTQVVTMPALDPDVEKLLCPYVKTT